MKRDIKICGLKTAEAVERAVSRGATHIGFIFFPKSPRNIEPDIAGKLADPVRGRAKVVAVTVDADNDDLDEIVDLLKPDILQLHGHETPERVLEVRALYGLPVMKALSIRDAADLDRVDSYTGIVDRFLFDAKPPASSELPGGNGVSFDWSVLRDLDGAEGYMLSGGLNRDNVAEAMMVAGSGGIDISSGVESAPGVKDPAMIDEFFDAINTAVESGRGVKAK